MAKNNIVIGFIGSTLDQGKNDNRWLRWRPTLSLLMHDDLQIDKLILLHDRQHHNLLKTIQSDGEQLSPNTVIEGRHVSIRDPWDFSDVYGVLYDFVKDFEFDTENNNYFLHITTGTHVAQICWFLLIDAHYLPAKLIQTSPNTAKQAQGEYRVIDLDLSRYDALKSRFADEQEQHWQQLKADIATKNPAFNQLISQVEKVATRSNAPILIMGATGVGKSQLAKQIFALKKETLHLTGRFIDVNCATLKGDSAMSALFGHIKGAFTGANQARDGWLKSADGGVLFLDEIGELGLDEQAMLLKALEDKSFFPVGSDSAIQVDFALIAGTNKDLRLAVQAGDFREDLWARLNTWTFFLPSLKQRSEDIAPNIEFELARFATQQQRQLRFYQDALQDYLAFAQSNDATWQGNFRDLIASVTRMATLTDGAYINRDTVHQEIDQLKQLWGVSQAIENKNNILEKLFSAERLAELDEFDVIQLQGVIARCMQCKSMADAGRQLFAQSRQDKRNTNDSDRIKKYLARFGLTWVDIESVK
ncbi:MULTISPECIES: RNA repair transcriptional activator RtcR [unclassified Acinetobacter]|uniref:RNA repair transcriptional activator RtcR n=1 Tax=unclassified Acinetobacter TaxID=196816 RepID=UPI0035BA42D4